MIAKSLKQFLTASIIHNSTWSADKNFNMKKYVLHIKNESYLLQKHFY